MTTLRKLAKENGKYEVNNNQYVLSRTPRIQGCFYEALAYFVYPRADWSAEFDEEYETPDILLRWEIINEDCEEETDACDWDNFEVIEL
jgi:hypothetical protein